MVARNAAVGRNGAAHQLGRGRLVAPIAFILCL